MDSLQGKYHFLSQSVSAGRLFIKPSEGPAESLLALNCRSRFARFTLYRCLWKESGRCDASHLPSCPTFSLRLREGRRRALRRGAPRRRAPVPRPLRREAARLRCHGDSRGGRQLHGQGGFFPLELTDNRWLLCESKISLFYFIFFF